jgi:hypothetical protein
MRRPRPPRGCRTIGKINNYAISLIFSTNVNIVGHKRSIFKKKFLRCYVLLECGATLLGDYFAMFQNRTNGLPVKSRNVLEGRKLQMLRCENLKSRKFSRLQKNMMVEHVRSFVY